MSEIPMPMLPSGFRVRLHPDIHRCTDGATLVGADGTVLRLRGPARARMQDGGVHVTDATSQRLARLLLDRGLAEPCWPAATAATDRRSQVTVVVPVRDRPAGLDRLLTGLPPVAEVLVVDDGSRDPDAIAGVTRRHGARLLRHPRSLGPAAARNAGLHEVGTPWVAFVDSDVVLDGVALDLLLRHLDDPRVGLVAPRVRGLGEAHGALGRYEAARSSLDMGPFPASVRPHARVSYVPSAVLLGRVSVLGDGFDVSMPVAEDVDLVWRVGRDALVRYAPEAVARHEHRTRPAAWFVRKACYGTGAAALARRHGRAVAPAVLTPWGAALTAVVLLQRRWSLPVACAIALGVQQRIARRLSGAEQPQRGAARLTAMAVRGLTAQAAAGLTRHYVPVTLALLPFSRRARRAWLAATIVPALAQRPRDAAAPGPATWVALRALDDLAYGLGLWWGCLRDGSPAALIPRLRVRGAPDRPGGETS